MTWSLTSFNLFINLTILTDYFVNSPRSYRNYLSSFLDNAYNSVRRLNYRLYILLVTLSTFPNNSSLTFFVSAYSYLLTSNCFNYLTSIKSYTFFKSPFLSLPSSSIFPLIYNIFLSVFYRSVINWLSK